MKKLAMLLICIALVITTVVGCSSSNNSSTEQGAKGNKNSTESVNDEEMADSVELKFYSWYSLEGDNFDKVLDAWHSEHPEIQVEFVSLSEKSDAAEYLKKLDLAAASGEQIDVMMFSNTAAYSQRVSAGLTAPLDEFVNKDGFKITDEYKFDSTINGSVHALPGKFVSWFVMINKNHLDEAGLEVPTDWTWDEYLTYAADMTKGEGASKRYGTYFHSWGGYFQLAQSNAPENNGLVTADGKLNIDTPRLHKSLEILNQGQNVDKSATPYADIISQKLNYRNIYFGEQASMITTGSWMIPEAAGTETVPATFQTVFAPYPKYSADDKAGLTVGNGDYIAVGEMSEHKEEAYAFVRWLSTEGLLVSGKFISGWQNADMDEMLSTAIATGKNPEMADLESLKNVMSATSAAPAFGLQSYYAEAEKAYIAEAERYLLGDTNLDQTIENAVKKVQEVIDANN
jgi:multiple sugar transport system substrate-binding protein